MRHMNPKSLTIVKANKIIEACYQLTLSEQRLILSCIGQIDSQEKLCQEDLFEMNAGGFADIFEITKDKAYAELKQVADKLFDRYIIIKTPDPKNPDIPYIKTRWVSSITYLPSKGRIRLRFAQDMLPYLGQLSREFTKYKLEHVAKFSSIYSIRLYELLVQWGGSGSREIEVEWLKQQFQIDAKYKRMYDLKKYVIEPAVNQINNYSNFWVKCGQRCVGRKISHLQFKFGIKGNGSQKQPSPKKFEKRIHGIPMSTIEREARPGESWDDVAIRLNNN